MKAPVFLAALLSALSALPAPKLVPDGILGQSVRCASPVGWTACRFCVSDAAGNVYFPDGWRLSPGAVSPVRTDKSVAGELLSDGSDVYSWRQEHGTLCRLKVSDEGLSETASVFRIGDWRRRPFLAAKGCRSGFAAKARALALDRTARAVYGWDASAAPLGKIFDYSSRLPRPELVRAAALHPETGELLLGTYWPECRVHRFGVDGSERVDEAWPFAVMAESFACAGKRVFALGSAVRELPDAFGGELRFGVAANEVKGLARAAGGWWVATTQGAQFYSDSAAACASPAVRRFGGLDAVTALGLSGGRILVASGWRIRGLWLDDRRDEPFDGDISWCSFGKWDGAVESVESRPDGGFAFTWRKGAESASWRFEPRYTEWKDRALRLRPVDAAGGAVRPAGEDYICGYRVAAEPKEIVLYDGARRVFSYPAAASAIAAEGRWLIAYVPQLKAILRMRFVIGP